MLSHALEFWMFAIRQHTYVLCEIEMLPHPISCVFVRMDSILLACLLWTRLNFTRLPPTFRHIMERTKWPAGPAISSIWPGHNGQHLNSLYDILIRLTGRCRISCRRFAAAK